MSTSPIQPNFSNPKPKFGGPGAYATPYPGLYGPFIMANPGLEQERKTSLLTKLLVGGIVIGGGAFALKKFSPEYYGKIASTLETVTPDFVKNGISSASAKVKNLLGIKTAEEATGLGGKIFNGLSSVVKAPFKFIQNLFSSAKPV